MKLDVYYIDNNDELIMSSYKFETDKVSNIYRSDAPDETYWPCSKGLTYLIWQEEPHESGWMGAWVKLPLIIRQRSLFNKRR